MEFTSTPSGAAIFDGEARIGTTPTKLMLPREKTSVLRFKLTGHQHQENTLVEPGAPHPRMGTNFMNWARVKQGDTLHGLAQLP
ncbi:hypothetical protein KH5H1_75350 [Corallococcus caeni]|nr:hypothetical protein KH5H1_75350 [Corallococcus sp. KH5-1]